MSVEYGIEGHPLACDCAACDRWWSRYQQALERESAALKGCAIGFVLGVALALFLMVTL